MVSSSSAETGQLSIWKSANGKKKRVENFGGNGAAWGRDYLKLSGTESFELQPH